VVASFLDRLAAVRQDQEPADSDATAGSAAADAALSSLAAAGLPAVARELAAAREQEVLHLVDAGQLQQLLAGLLPLIKQSASLQLPGDEQVGGASPASSRHLRAWQSAGNLMLMGAAGQT
jgi:hypothetical protein